MREKLNCDCINNTYEVYCWFKESGESKTVFVDAKSTEEAEIIFRYENPEMDCDPPYLKEG